MKKELFALIGLLACLGSPVFAGDSSLVFNEVHFHPSDAEESLEWVELRNQNAVDLDISGWAIAGGVSYLFPEGTIVAGGGYVVIARDPAALESATGLADIHGPWAGRLDNSGEELVILDRSGRTMDELDYRDGGDWPMTPDGSGVTLAKLDELRGSARSENWRASRELGGTPGAVNFPSEDGGTTFPQGLVAYFSFDDESGVVRDEVDGRIGMPESGATPAPGLIGSGAYAFNGTIDAAIDIGSDDFPLADGVTIEAVIQLEWSGTPGENAMIFRKEDGTRRLVLGFQADGNADGQSDPPLGGYDGPVLAFGARIDGVYRELDVPLDGQDGRPLLADLKDGAAHHIAASLDVDTGRKSVSIDGEEVFAIDFAAGSALETGGVSRAYIGNMTGRRQPFDGLIDELAIWGRGLGSAEIASHAAAARAGRSWLAPPDEGGGGGEIPLAFNEVVASSNGESFVEILNTSSKAIALGGIVVRPRGVVASDFILPEEDLPAGSRRSFDTAELGFDLASGMRLFLFSPSGDRVIDGVAVADGARARFPEASGPWLVPDRATPGAANVVTLRDEIVINEIHYHPFAEPARDPRYAENQLLAIDAEWRYDDRGVDLGEAWRASDFDDSSWASGAGLLYVETAPLPGPKNTPLEIGATTYYFRTEFDFDGDPAGFALRFHPVVDDGLVAYLNGEEAVRVYMPAGDIDAQTTAARSVGDASFLGPFELPLGMLRRGRNVIAVEVHQATTNSSDVVFGAELVAAKLVAPGNDYRESAESWVELYNRSSQAVDLGGWSFDRGIQYRFEPGTTIAGHGYLVLSGDVEFLRNLRPGIVAIGDFEGRLSNRSDRLLLVDERGNPADEVEYFDSGRWPWLADGGGSTLELRDPDADNSVPEAWAASDESEQVAWREYSYRSVSRQVVGPTRWNEFVMGLNDAGEIWIDDLHVVESPGGAEVELLENGDFESGTDHWRLLGTHRHSQVIADPSQPGNHVLRLVASGPTEHMHNHLETTLRNNARIVDGREYEVSFRARWVAGARRLNTRLYFNRVPETTLLDVAELAGTPGGPNSTAEANIGPTFASFGHTPAVPAPGEAVSVSVAVSDPDGVRGATLFYSVDGRTPQSLAMSAAGTANGASRFRASVPGESAGRTVQFWVEAEDESGAISTFPLAGAESRALWRVDDGRARHGRLHDFRIIMLPEDVSFLHEDTNVMSNDRMGASVVYREDEVYYDVGVKLKGSERGRPGGSRVSFSVEFQRDHPFRGVHSVVALDRSGGWGIGAGPTSQEEIISKHIVAQSGVPAQHDDLCYLIAPRSAQDDVSILMMSRYGADFLDGLVENGSDGMIHKLELIYYPTTTVDGRPDSLKRPQPDEVLGTDFRDLGDDPEAYRWNFLIENNEDRDDFGPLMELAQTLGLPAGAEFQERIENILDVDEATRMYVLHSLIGANDTYILGSNAHNLFMYQRPDDGRFLLLFWDQDFAWSRSTTNPLWGGENLAKLFSVPKWQRLFYAHVFDITESTVRRDYLERWTTHYGELANEQTTFARVLSYALSRATFARSRLPAKIPFEITTNGGEDFETDERDIELEGRGWIDVRTVVIAGRSEIAELEWIGIDRWRATIPLLPGENEINLVAFDLAGSISGSAEIRVTSTAEPLPSTFIRGDANLDGAIDLSDAIGILLGLFAGGDIPCADAADVDDSEKIELTDPVRLLDYLFRGGEAPPAPFPTPGEDTTGDGRLDCARGIGE